MSPPAQPGAYLIELTNATYGVDTGQAGVATVTKPAKRGALLRALRTVFSKRGTLDAHAAPPQAVSGDAQFANCRVLVVEDNEVNRLVAVGFLLKHGCEVVTVINGVEALSAMSRQSFDLVLMDIQMPELDGYETTAQIRVREQHEGRARVPIVAFTANAMSSDPEKCLAAGMDDYLPKPIEPKRFEDALRRWIGNAAARPVVRARDLEPQAHVDTAIDVRVAHNLKRAVGSAFAAIVDAYRSEAPEAVTKMRDALRRHDRDVLRREAHALKSASATVGAHAVEAAARELEGHARDAGVKTLEALLGRIEPRINVAVVALEQVQNEAAVESA